VLKEDAVVDEVIAAARPGLSPDAILVDHSTTLPKLTAERFARLSAQGIGYLHCPVFMGPPAARNAQGLMLAAGPKALFDKVKDDLARMTGKLEYLGERTDLGAVDKLLGNAMIIGTWAVLADVLTLAKACGVDGADAVKLLGFIDMNAMMARRAPSMAAGDFTPNFELAMARKDVRLMLEAIGERPLAALPGIAARMDRLIEQGHGARDAGVLSIDAVPGS